MHFSRAIPLLLHSVWALPCAVLIRLLSPFVLIRLGTIRSDRIGHFVEDAVEQKARLALSENGVDFFWLPKETCNHQWEQMVRRELPVFDCSRYVDWWNQRLPNASRYHRPSTFTGSRDIHGICRDGLRKFEFNSYEKTTAEEWLGSLGWNREIPFVCLIVRDPIFLQQDPLQRAKGLNSTSHWDYHDYRNSDVRLFSLAIMELVEQGFFVFRMGSIAQTPLNIEHPQVIDYAFRSDKSSFLDVWLFANCKFCISTGTGPDAISMVSGKPNLYINALPFADLHSFHASTWIPKSLLWAETGAELTLREYFESHFFATRKFEDAGIKINSLNAGEISKYVDEFARRCSGLWVDSEEDIAMHRRFWKILEDWGGYSKYHCWRHAESRTSTRWLRSKAATFFD